MVMVFNSHMVSRKGFEAACPAWLHIPSPTTWVPEFEMTDQEKLENTSFHTCCGYLRENDWMEEWQKAFESASPEDVRKVRNLPGFDAAIFQEITGLDLSTPSMPTDNKPKEITI